AGGTSSSFADLRRRWGYGLDVRPVEYPGRGSRWHEPACETLDALVETVADGLRPELAEPSAFLGHSFGALVAFELARRLDREGGPMPVRLIASAARAPHLRPPEVIHDLPDAEFLVRLVSFGGVPREALDSEELLAV